MNIQRLGLATGALVGALVTAPLLGLMYLGNELAGLPFSPYDLFDWATRVLPGGLVTFGIDMMIDTLLLFGISRADTAKTAEKIVASLQFFFIGVGAGAIFFGIMRLRDDRPDLQAGLVFGGIVGLPMITISIAIGGSDREPFLSILWLLALFLLWGVALREGYTRLNPEEGLVAIPEGEARVAKAIDRRQFLIRVGGATATITVASTALGSLLASAARRELEEELAASMAHLSTGSAQSPFPNASDPLMPAPGTRPEYTPLKDHYQVFIRVSPTRIDGETWSLPIMGAVANPMTLTIDDIRNNYESHDQYVTLSCISGRIGTTLISTTQWTGVSVQDILADLKPNANARYLHITSGDGFYETVDLDLIASDERIMLAYAWDGNPIPLDHGFPLRIWLPDRFGMKQPKWITGIEVMEEYKGGVLGRAWMEQGGPSPCHVGYRHRGRACHIPEQRPDPGASRRHRVRRRPRNLQGRGSSRRRPLAGGHAEDAAVRDDLGDLALRLAVPGGQAQVRGAMCRARRHPPDRDRSRKPPRRRHRHPQHEAQAVSATALNSDADDPSTSSEPALSEPK